MSANESIVSAVGLEHRYGDRVALHDVSLEISRGEVLAFLGPNGGGKTTLFKILSTLVAPTAGRVSLFGIDAVTARDDVRQRIGVVFQSPGLDPKLTVLENLHHFGEIFCMPKAERLERAQVLLEDLGVRDRSDDLVEELSGGLARRVELARALLHGPELLLLDEPTSGLDPGARRDFTRLLRRLRDQSGVTVVLTTHFMEEAEAADRVMILDRGAVVATGSPAELKRNVGGDVVVAEGPDVTRLAQQVEERFGCQGTIVEGALRIERENGHEFVRDLVEAFPDDVHSVRFGRPTLEDVYVHATGRSFWNEEAE